MTVRTAAGASGMGIRVNLTSTFAGGITNTGMISVSGVGIFVGEFAAQRIDDGRWQARRRE